MKKQDNLINELKKFDTRYDSKSILKLILSEIEKTEIIEIDKSIQNIIDIKNNRIYPNNIKPFFTKWKIDSTNGINNCMLYASLLGLQSKCVSYNVGSIIVKDNRIISVGYNGTPAGYLNCNDKFHGVRTSEHHIWSNQYEIHSEMNSILYAARNGNSILDSEIFVSLKPCWNCAKHIVASGIKSIFYNDIYDKIDNYYELDIYLKENKINNIYLEN